MDLNKDGYIDILSGSYSRKTENIAGEFHVFYGEPGGGFKKSVVLQNSKGEPLEIHRAVPEGVEDARMANITDVICTRPYAVDLNADGNLDIVSGNFTGSFAVFWSDSSGQFSTDSTMLHDSDNNRLVVGGGHSDPTFTDWDGDGDLDMLSGAGKGGAYLFENVGDKSKPVFAAAVQLVEPAPEGDVVLYGANIHGPQTSTRVVAADVNGDGKLDLLVGDSAAIYSPGKGKSESECLNQLSEWNKQWAALQTSNTGSADSREHLMAQGKLQMELYEFLERKGTGFVWLYLKK